MKRKNIFHTIMAIVLCTVLILTGVTLPVKAVTAQAIPKMQGLAVKSIMAGTVEFTWGSDYEQYLSGYQVYYATSKSGKYTKLATVKTNSYKAKLTAGKTYYAKVRAYAKSGGKVYYGKFSDVVKVVVLKEQSIININDSGKAYGNYIKISDVPKEIIDQLKYVYTNGILTVLSIQYLTKGTNDGRWVDFFEEVSKDNNPVMGKNEYVGMFRFEIISKDPIDTVQQYYEAMKPDKHTEWFSNNMNNPVLNYNRTGGTGVYMLTLFKNPALDSNGWVQEYLDMKDDGYITTISGVSEWIPN